MFLLAPLILTLADIILAGILREELVYPELLQQRSDDGSLLLRINHDMTLYLRKSSVLADDLFITTKAGAQSEATLWNGSRIQENLYHDSKHQSSVMLYQGDHELKVEGIITATLRIKPVESSERSGDARVLHKVYEIEDPKRYFGKALSTWTWPFNVPWFKFPSKPQSQTPSPKLSTVAQVPEEYVAEVHVVSCSVHERQFKADEDLIAYVAILMNAVNIWYEGMDNPRLRTKVVGITRNKDGESEVRRDGFLIADRTINRFVDDAEVNIPGAPDAVYLMTSQDLAYVSPSGSIDGSVAGLAFVGQLCSSRNVAIGEDPAGSFKGVYPAAHELAHVFGSAHDGEPGVSHIPDNPGAKDCPWEEGYLMSYADGGTKKFQMSPCTKAQIRAQLSDLPQSCLDEVSNINYMANYKQVPGPQISPEDYCNVVTKNRGVPLLQQDMLKQCRFQCCVRTYYGPGECSTEYALEGMPCGTDKTCRKGVCGDFKWEN